MSDPIREALTDEREKQFHIATRAILSKREQGLVMGAFRAILAANAPVAQPAGAVRVCTYIDSECSTPDICNARGCRHSPLAHSPEPARSKCKPGGCASIGCEGGRYCFNDDGTRKVADGSVAATIFAAPTHVPENSGGDKS